MTEINLSDKSMKSYNSISPVTGKRSSIQGYEYGENYITIYFSNGYIYTYTLESCGFGALATMKRLADAQNGLNTYLTKMKPQYASKTR